MSKRCDSCNLTFVSWAGISGIVHERGCPEAWRDEVCSCTWCGTDFKPEERGQAFCDPSCADSNYDTSFWNEAAEDYEGACDSQASQRAERDYE